MDEEIGVAADGGGEVTIVLTGEGVVANGLGGIFSAGEAFEDGEIDGEGFRFAANAGEEVLDGFAIEIFGELVAGNLHEMLKAGGFDLLAELGAADYLHYPDAKDRYGVWYCLVKTATGERLIVNLTDGVSKMEGGGQGVEALFEPKSKSEQKSESKPEQKPAPGQPARKK